MSDSRGANAAQKIAEQSQWGSRKHSGALATLVSVTAGAWSLFQLSLPKFILIDTVHIRCIHLAFAIFLVYLCFPARKKAEKKFPPLDLALALTAAGAALYLSIDYLGISERQGAPLGRDIFAGILLIGLLLEAARRSLGPALPCIAGVFIAYSFLGPYMPELIAFKGVSLRRFFGQVTLSTEGIYGVPLDVSATIVFLFVLFGSMLDKAGAGNYFVQLAFSLLGTFRGGPAKAAVLASGLTGIVSGSSIANTVTTGTFTIPLMKRVGYPAEKAGAIEVAASTNGQLMPPIMGAAAFIIAEYCNITYMEVVRAAAVPAIISYAALIYITHLEALKLGFKGIARKELPPFKKTFLSGVHFLIPLAALLFELMVLRHSAELSAFNAIVVLSVLILIKDRSEGFKKIWDSLVAGGLNMMSIGVAVSAAGIIVGVVTMGLGGLITDIIDTLANGNIYLLLVITAIVSLILGMGLPTTANYIVMASLTAPVIVTLGGDYGLVVPLIAAHLFCFYFGILADDTPPVGLAAYAASAIAQSHPIRTGVQGFIYDMRTAILPFMFIFNTDLLLIGIDSVWHIAAVFASGLLAMFAFASVTQNHFIKKNKFHESALLGLVAFILLRPDLGVAWIGIESKFLVYMIGLGIYFSVFASQKLRKTP